MKKRWVSLGSACLLALALYSFGSDEALAGRNGSSVGNMWQRGENRGQATGDMAQVRSRMRQQNLGTQTTSNGQGGASGVCDGTGRGNGKGRGR